MTNIDAKLAEEYAMHTSQSFFLTGKAGTGKTTLLKKIIKESKKNIAVVAPTGVAAINAGGSTIHSMFGFPLKIFVPTFDRVDINSATNKALLKNHLRYRTEKRKIIQELEMLIIDEISMVRADMLDAIDYALKYTRKNQMPFGGVQLVVIGDLFQLSPIARDEDWSVLRNYYKSPYFYHSMIWNETKPLIIELKKVYRQEEETFIHILNSIRNGNPESESLDLLNERYDPDFTAINNESIILTTHNYKADDVNLKALNSLESRAHKFKAELTGSFSESSYPADEVLTLKEGAQIMFLRNDTEEGAYFNGKLAKVQKINNDDIKVEFLDDNGTYFLKKEIWENKVYTIDKTTNEISQEIVGSFKQYPVRLAWAITIHKSQGLTFDKAVIDVEDAFAMGQTYVALSRCTNLKGMVLKSKVSPRSVSVNSEVKAFYQNAPDAEVIAEGLQLAKNLYSRKKLKSAFNFGYLLDDLEDWKVVLDKKDIPEKSKAMLLSMNLSQTLKNLDNVSKSFQAQLDKLFKNYEISNDSKIIVERAKKAISFFSHELFKKSIKPVHLHIQEFALKKSVKAYLGASEDLLSSLWGKLNVLYAADFLENPIWNEDKYQLNDLPKTNINAKKAKASKGDTFLITLNLFKEGKNIHEISELRSMAISTVESHLAKWVLKDKIQISELMDMAKVKTMLPYYINSKDLKLGELKKAIPFGTNYSELKFVLAHYQSNLEKGNLRN